MIKLNDHAIAAVTYRAVLPEWLGPGGECFFEAKARASGQANPGYMAAIEKLIFDIQVQEQRLARITNDEANTRANAAAVNEATHARRAIFFDHCVVSWGTNVQDDGHTLESTRDSFLALWDVNSNAVISALNGLEERCQQASDDTILAVEEDVKN